MVSSWLSSDTNKCENTSRVEPIKSLLRSLNLNRARLPGTLTFRDEPPGPEKSLCEIVSRISNRVDIDSKLVSESSIEFIQHNTIKNDSRESCDLNSRTESAIGGLSTRINNDENDNVIRTGYCGTIYQRAHLDAESLEAIRKWGSARSFAPKIGDINNDTRSIESSNSQKKVVSTFWQNTNTPTTTINFNNSGLKSNSLNDRTNVLGGKQFATSAHRQGLHAQLSERSENSSTQTPNSQENQQHQLFTHPRVDIVKKPKYLLHDKVSQGNLSINVDEILDEKKLNETNNENPLHRIHLSINNYFNSPRDSLKLHDEIIDGREKKSSTKNVSKMIGKRKSVDKTLKERQQIKRVSPINLVENNESKFKFLRSLEPELGKLLTEVDVTMAPDKGLPDVKHLNNTNGNHRDCQQVFKIHGDFNPVTSANHSVNRQRKKQFKMNHTKNRLEAVLSGDHKTVAKPSEILIPQSVRGRHIFQPFADIQEHSETIRLARDYIKKKRSHFDHNQHPFSTFKTFNNINPIWKPTGNTRSLPTRRNTIYEDNQRVEVNTNASVQLGAKPHENKVVIESNVPVIRSKTFIAASRNSGIAGVNDNCQRSFKMNKLSDGIVETGQFDNCHSKSLRMLKELLDSTDEEYIAERSVKHFDDTVRTDECSYSMIKSINDNESQTTQKSEMTQSLQTVSEDVEHLDASTVTDVNISLRRDTSMDTGESYDDFPSVSIDHFDQTFVDAGVSCSFPTIASFDEESSNAANIKTYRMIETQTSKTSHQSSSKEKKDTSAETVRVRLHSKYVNTEQCVLIDTATGKDFLEIQNFCCDTQITNTESSMFDNHSVHDFKRRINSLEFQENTCTNICSDLISSSSNELVFSERSLIANEKSDKAEELPDGVVRAFEFATERAQNLHRAIEIYHKHEMKKQNELNVLFEENQKDRKIIDLLREEERKLQSLIVALEQISETEKVLQTGLEQLVSQQEVQFTLDKLLDHVVKEVKPRRQCGGLKHSISDGNKKFDINSEWIRELERSSLPSMYPTSRTKILPIVYGAVCSLIFWSLQCSTSCELE